MTPTTTSVDEHLWNRLETAGIEVHSRQGVVLQDQLDLPVTERVTSSEGVVLMHQHLLGDEAYIAQLLAAVDKVNGQLGEVKEHFAE